jgi:hypothetical protein
MDRQFKVFLWLFASFVALVLAFLGCRSVADISGHTHNVAQEQAEAFVKQMELTARPACAASDTDGDGYVSCPLVFPDGRMEPLECAGSFTINSGCRPPKAVIRGDR